MGDSQRVSISFGSGVKLGFSIAVGMLLFSIICSIILVFVGTGFITTLFNETNSEGGSVTIDELGVAGMINMFDYGRMLLPW